jgi:hypothetical protein
MFFQYSFFMIFRCSDTEKRNFWYAFMRTFRFVPKCKSYVFQPNKNIFFVIFYNISLLRKKNAHFPFNIVETKSMDEQLINKNVSEEDILLIRNAFADLEKNIKKVIYEIFFQETDLKVFFKPSHYTLSLANRVISLNKAYITLTKENNYTTAVALIRLQIDSCLRLFALMISSDWKDFYDDVMDGKEVRNLKDCRNKKMTDGYLVDEYQKVHNDFKSLYKKTCGFVHFSNSIIDLTSEYNDSIQKTLPTKISINGIDDISIPKKVDYDYNMFLIGKSFLKQLKLYKAVTKERFLDKIS